MIGIVDYGLGNVLAIANIYRRLGIAVTVATTAADLELAERVVLPGVGAFDWAMMRLDQSGMRATLEELVITKRRPVLGICVGMQMFARRSDEGERAGLGWIDADVRVFDTRRFTDRTRLPHMGWNDVTPVGETALFRGLETGARFYFLHSYYVAPDNTDDTIATTDYFGGFTSAIRVGNVVGVQFHPEKSHQWGVSLLKNFSEM